MKICCYLLSAAMMMLGSYIAAQSPLTATTEDGRKVILLQDGTWRYSPAGTAISQPDPATYKAPASATEVFSINNGAASLHYDPAVWSIKKQEGPSKTVFVHKSGDAQGMIIAERLEMSQEALKELVFTNARKAATSVEVLHDEKRVVNGSPVLYLSFEPTIQGIVFVFEGYYYAGPAGTIQVISYTGKNLISEYRDVMQGFLNGLEILPPKKAQ